MRVPRSITDSIKRKIEFKTCMRSSNITNLFVHRDRVRDGRVKD